MEIREISQFLNGMAEDVCRRLLPNGKRQGKEWVVGSLQGEKGTSLTICIHGKKTGVWRDNATGESGGDLIDLWKGVEGLSLKDALDSIRIIYHINNPSFKHHETKREYSKPEILPIKPDVSVTNYLLNERKLTPDTIKAFQVKSSAEFQKNQKEKCPPSFYLPFMKDGILVGWKLTGIQRSKPRFMKQSIGCQPIAFGWQAVDDNSRTLVIAEGEIDAMTWHQMGYSSVSLPMGAGGGSKLDWIEHDYDELERFDQIYLSMDNDEHGQNTIQPLSERLGIHRCSIVTLPLKDANECLMAGMGKETFDKAISEARELSISTLQSILDFSDDIDKILYGNDNGSKPGQPYFLKPEDFRFRDSEITVWTGVAGHGKSMQIGQTMLDLSINRDIRFCIASMEMSPGMTFARMVRQATATAVPSLNYKNHVLQELKDHAFVWNRKGQIDTEDLINCFIYARKRYGCTHFVVDSLMKCGMGPDDYKGQKKFMDKLCDFKDKYKVHVHLVAHNRKSDSENSPPGKMDIHGGIDVVNMADNIICVHRNKNKEDQRNTPLYSADEPDGFSIILKQRNGEWEGKIHTWFDLKSYQYRLNPKEDSKYYINYSEVI